MSISLECETRSLDQRSTYVEEESDSKKLPEPLKADLYIKKPTDNGVNHQLNRMSNVTFETIQPSYLAESNTHSTNGDFHDVDLEDEERLLVDESTNDDQLEVSDNEEKLLLSDDENSAGSECKTNIDSEKNKIKCFSPVNEENLSKSQFINCEITSELQQNNDNENLLSAELNECHHSVAAADTSKESRIAEQLTKVELLKDELKCEEAALIFLKKIVESQQENIYGKVNCGSSNLHSRQITHVPKGNASSKQLPLQPNKSNQPNQQSQKYYIQVGNQLVPAPAAGTPGTNQSNQYINTPNGSQSSQPQSQKQTSIPPKISAEQKQNAAKTALHRQLEQTLLQIPPPRPPPADWKAIPNVNSMDFMMLVGLDEVVDSILEMDSKPTIKKALAELIPYNPRVCNQCNVDFSPCWKSKDGEDFVLCERCALQNIKRDLKAEHTKRLKDAFLKALTQEQEIEERIKAGEEVNIPNLTSNDKIERINQPSPTFLHQIPLISLPQTHPIIQPSHLPQHVQSPTESRNQPSANNHHHRPVSNHHQHKIVSHYPHHTSLVQQLHHQHIQQQQHEIEPQRHSSSRWHPYMSTSSHHHREHGHHRSYNPSPSSGDITNHQEYYVVHHPQHSSVRYISR
ncbi:transcriptional repressor p66-beta isoform X1 [Hydra vulgaris]|uniref:Transcriptional repressor p66-beta isoform X1 n=1 Tax=Hydra vulgaris TaxID=6087 RepID=A0ABM4DD05_HYDVU